MVEVIDLEADVDDSGAAADPMALSALMGALEARDEEVARLEQVVVSFIWALESTPGIDVNVTLRHARALLRAVWRARAVVRLKVRVVRRQLH
jgi:hypothetical protein